MSHIESLNVIDDPARLFEATLKDAETIQIDIDDEDGSVRVAYSLDEIKAIISALGHLVWVAENTEY